MELAFITEIVAVFVLAFVGGYVAVKINQPPLLGYLVSGIFLSLNVFSDVVTFETSADLAQLGVALLLFATGLEFPITKLLRIKKEVIIGSILQVAVSILISTFVLSKLSFSVYEAFFISTSFSNSATVVILKIIEKKSSENVSMFDLTVKWLILQDIIMVALAVIVNQVSESGNFDLNTILSGVVKSLIFISISIILGKTIIPKLFEYVAKINSLELLLVLSFVFCLIVAFIAQIVGISYALGAFLAGVMISESFVNHELFSQMKPIKNIFSVIFFVTVGSLISFSYLMSNILYVLLTVVLLLVIKVVVTFIIIMILEKHTRKAFSLAVILMQGGEFAFILGQIGLNNDWISNDFYSLIIIVTVISILITPFAIKRYSSWYRSIRKWIRSKNPKLYRNLFVKWDRLTDVDHPDTVDHVVICGYGRVGSYVGKALDRANIPYIVVDTDSDVIDYCKRRGIKVVFGDASNIDVLETADVERAIAIVVSLPEKSAAELITKNAKKLNNGLKIIARSHLPGEDAHLKKKGVTETVEPEFEAAISISKKLLDYYNKSINISSFLYRSRGQKRRQIKKAEKYSNTK